MCGSSIIRAPGFYDDREWSARTCEYTGTVRRRARRPFIIRALRVPRHASHESRPLETFLDVVPELVRRRLDSSLELQPAARLWSRKHRGGRSRSADLAGRQSPIVF